MQFQDELAGGVVLVRPALQSPNFAAGSDGWQIAVDGSAEFNDVTVRGSLHAGDASDYIDIDPSPSPLITISTSDPDQISPGQIGYTVSGGNSLFVRGSDFGQGADFIDFQADPVVQIMEIQFNDTLEINRGDFATRILMDSNITVVGDTDFLGSVTADNARWGTAQTAAPGAGGGTTTVNVVFADAMPNTPRVTISPVTTVDPGTVTIVGFVDNVATTGFTIRAYRSTNSATNWSYVALSD